MSKEKNKVVNRNFYSKKEFKLESRYMIEYLKEFCNQHILYFEVDSVKTKTHDLYGIAESTKKVYKEKRELLAKVNVTEEEKDFENKGFGYEEKVVANFSIPEMILEQNSIRIKIGDFIIYDDLYFEVGVVHNIPKASILTKNIKNKMRKYSAYLIKEDSVPINLLDNDNEIN